MRRMGLILAISVLVTTLFAGVALAAFPGKNGRIAFTRILEPPTNFVMEKDLLDAYL